MNTKKFKNQLNKLTAVFTSIEGDGQISPLEKDLLKKYVVNLYDALIDQDEKASPNEVVSKIVEVTKAKETPPIVKVSNPETIAVQKTVVEEEQVVIESHPPIVVIENKEVQAQVREVSPEPIKPAGYVIPSKLKEVFETEEAIELSDKLRLTKVKDITKSMGINEKIFTIKELFGGNQDKFNEVMNAIEACKDYEEATKYISENIAEQQNWADDSNLKKAKQFVQLVQRKFA